MNSPLSSETKNPTPASIGVVFLVEFVAVKRIADFRAQRVARAEAGGFQTKRPPTVKKFIPKC